MKGDPEGEHVRGPSNGAPIGVTVHAFSNEAGEPYASIHGAAEPAPRHLQHQPVIFDKDPEVVADKPDVNRGITAGESTSAHTIASGPFRKEEKSLSQAPVTIPSASDSIIGPTTPITPKVNASAPAVAKTSAPAPAPAAPVAEKAQEIDYQHLSKEDKRKLEQKKYDLMRA